MRENTVLFKKNKAVIQDHKGNHILTANKTNGLCYLQTETAFAAQNDCPISNQNWNITVGKGN